MSHNYSDAERLCEVLWEINGVLERIATALESVRGHMARPLAQHHIDCDCCGIAGACDSACGCRDTSLPAC